MRTSSTFQFQTTAPYRLALSSDTEKCSHPGLMSSTKREDSVGVASTGKSIYDCYLEESIDVAAEASDGPTGRQKRVNIVGAV